MNIKAEIEKLKEQIAKLEMMAKQSEDMEMDSEEMETEEVETESSIFKKPKLPKEEAEPQPSDDESNMKKNLIMSMMKKKGY